MATDRRVKYTKMVLQESLIKFLEKKPISRITIKEICADADINRATYYAHYTDQFDQLKQIEAEFLSGINTYLDDNDLEKNLIQKIEKILEYIKQNDKLFRVLLGKNGDIDFQNDIMQILKKRLLEELILKDPIDVPIGEYMYTFILTGCIGIIRRWLFVDSDRSPHEIAILMSRFTDISY